jgi:hypothetical protein
MLGKLHDALARLSHCLLADSQLPIQRKSLEYLKLIYIYLENPPRLV